MFDCVQFLFLYNAALFKTRIVIVHSVVLKFLLLPVLTAVSFGVYANSGLTGNKYVGLCQHFVKTNTFDDGQDDVGCIFYTAGALEASALTSHRTQKCWLKTYPHVTTGQIIKITYQYLQKNPKELNQNAAVSILMAKFINFPLLKKCRG